MNENQLSSFLKKKKKVQHSNFLYANPYIAVILGTLGKKQALHTLKVDSNLTFIFDWKCSAKVLFSYHAQRLLIQVVTL